MLTRKRRPGAFRKGRKWKAGILLKQKTETFIKLETLRRVRLVKLTDFESCKNRLASIFGLEGTLFDSDVMAANAVSSPTLSFEPARERRR